LGESSCLERQQAIEAPACDYTNRPEVTAASHAIAGSSPSEGSATPIVADQHGGDLDVHAERLGTIVLPTFLTAAEDLHPSSQS
jgi:hypothetical protein